MKCDCTWFIKFKPVIEKSTTSNLSSATTTDGNLTNVQQCKRVMITEISNMHNHETSPQEKLTVAPKSTKTKKIDPIVFVQLVHIRITLNHRLPTRLIRSFLRDALPNSMYMSPKFLINVRSRIEKLAQDPSVVETDNISVESLTQLLKPTNWMPELHNILSENVSPVYKHLDKLFELIEDVDKVQELKLERILSTLQDADKSFLYVMGKNPSKQFTGAAWQTGVMRSSMERYGHYLALDGMKRELNDRHWCYFAVSILNDVHESQVVIECLAVGERLDVYKFMLDALIRFTAMNVNKTKICASDAFLDDDFIKHFFPRSNYIRDRYHLVENVKTKVGLRNWYKYESLFYAMVKAKDEASFNTALRIFLEMCGADNDLKDYFQILVRNKASYADYILSTYEGNLGLRGSTIAEANNSSVLNFIHDITSARTIEDLVNLLLRRKQEKEKKTNHKLMNEYLQLQGEQRSLTGWQLNAAKGLCLESYNRFCDAVAKTNDYSVYESDRDTLSSCVFSYIDMYILESSINDLQI